MTCSAVVRIKLNDLKAIMHIWHIVSTQILATKVRYFVIAYYITGIGGILISLI